jgi:glycosyltransferase involved in cell wall biosynthesis
VGDAGVYFSGSEGVPDLARQLERLISDPERVADYRSRALERAELYSWDAVAAAYEQLLLEVSGAQPRTANETERERPLSQASR